MMIFLKVLFTAEYWEYDSRVGRRWNNDPLVYEWQSPYACFNNNPICFADPTGLEGEDVKKGDGNKKPGTPVTKEGSAISNGDGSVSGNKDGTICGYCGENGQHIYGLPPSAEESTKPSESPRISENGGEQSGGGGGFSKGGSGGTQISPNFSGGIGKDFGSKLNKNDESGEWVARSKELTFGAGLFANVIKEGSIAASDFTPRKPQRSGQNIKILESQKNSFLKMTKYTSRVSNVLTGADMILSFLEYKYTKDKTWGAKTKLGVNLSISIMGIIREPTMQILSVGLGVSETAGAFNGLYKYADMTEKSGLIIIPTTGTGSNFMIFKIK